MSTPAFLRLRNVLFALLAFAFGAAPAVTAEVKLLGPAQAWEAAEFQIEGGPMTKNNFDPNEVRVDATFTSDGGRKVTVPAFWFQDYRRKLVNGKEVLTPVGEGQWRVRFTPTEQGHEAVEVSQQIGGAAAEKIAEFSFQVEPREAKGTSNREGWVQVHSDKHDFQTSDGKILKLIGSNICWSGDGGTFDYDHWFERMQVSGQNLVRLWLSPWFMNLEHGPGTLNHYRQEGAWELDTILRSAEARGIYVLLCFDHHGMFQVANHNWGGSNNYWHQNPYSKEAGGPCATPNDFFTGAEARELYQRKLRFLIARYSYSSHLLGWEFFNEIDNVYAPNQTLVAADVRDWHAVMAKWIHENDPFHHLVTSSLTGGSDRPELWKLPGLDFTGYHSYWDPAPARLLARLSQDFVKRYDKPVMIGEFGVSARDWQIELDPHLRGFRQALWGSALGGSVGSALPWWWEQMDEHDVYPLFGALARITAAAAWDDGTWSAMPLPAGDETPAEVGEPIENGAVFSATLPLSDYRRIPLSGKVALVNPLAAARASEALSAYLNGSADGASQRPMRLSGNFGAGGKLSFTINSVAGMAELVVRVDGRERERVRLVDADGRVELNHEINRTFEFELAPGRHQIEIANEGRDWAYVEKLKVDGLRTSGFPNGWEFHPLQVGLRSDATKRALLYVNSPYITYPAGATLYRPPLVEGGKVRLQDWPEGRYTARWYSPVDGSEVGTTEAVTTEGVLTLPLPAFNEDLAGIVQPATRK